VQRKKYDMRRDDRGWTVYVIETGLTVIVRCVPQIGLPFEEANDLVDGLNRLAGEADKASKS
jgi:hypothetical protein